MGIRIITDSTSYISENLLQKYNIRIVSLSVLVGEESIREVDISHKEFYEKMAKAKTIPTSSQPALMEMYDAFEAPLRAGDDVVAVFLSSQMSGTYTTALMVKKDLLEKYPNRTIEVVDALTNSMQLGFCVLEAAKAAEAGKTPKQVAQRAIDVRQKSQFLFTPAVLDYLKKGGRIGKAATLLGNLLQIRPILTVNDEGVADVFMKVRTKKKAVETIVQTILDHLEQHKVGGIMVHHIDCIEEGKALAKRLEEALDIKVDIQSIGPIIGVHVGPGAIGVAYWWE